MKKYVLEFFRKGLTAAGFGPIVLAVLYLILQKQGIVQSLTVNEVCLGIFSLFTLAFIAGGMNIVYQILLSSSSLLKLCGVLPPHSLPLHAPCFHDQNVPLTMPLCYQLCVIPGGPSDLSLLGALFSVKLPFLSLSQIYFN